MKCALKGVMRLTLTILIFHTVKSGATVNLSDLKIKAENNITENQTLMVSACTAEV